MKTAHTPGPWSVCVADDDQEVACTVFADSQLVNGRIEAGSWDDHIATAGLNHENYEANAHLIAASPDLLTWLKWALDRVKDDAKSSWQYEQARASISKATGGAE